MRPARSGQARAPQRTQTAPHTSGYAPKLHIHHHRAARTASALCRMSSCTAESHGLSMQLAQVRADQEGSQKRSPKVCAPQVRQPPEHSASHGLSARPSQGYSSRLPTALNSSLRVAAPLPHTGAHQTESCPVQTSDPPRAIPHNGLIHDRRHCRTAPTGQCPPSSCTLLLLSHPCCTLARP